MGRDHIETPIFVARGAGRKEEGDMNRRRILPGVLVCSVALLSAAWTWAQAATVTTDKNDYSPGETVVITGSGWTGGETVVLTLAESPPIDTHGPYTSVTDANGHFVNTDFVPNAQDVGVTFTLTATGQTSGWTATTTFTDAGVNLDQLQNGTLSKTPEWANGDINKQNSCYAEGDVVPYRYFVTTLGAVTPHSFTIQFQFTKGGVHAF